MRRTARRLTLLMLAGLLSPGIGGAQTADTPRYLQDVSVERHEDGLAVRLKTSGPVKYSTTLIDSPTRLVIDIEGTSAWQRKLRPEPEFEPIREIRGSQWKAGISRVVVELTRVVGYRLDESPDGLVAILGPGSTARAPGKPGPARGPSAASPEGASPAPDGTRATDELKPSAASSEGTNPALGSESAIASAGPAAPSAAAPAPAPAPIATVARPVIVAQAQPAPAPVPAPQSQVPSGSRLISMDFRNADVTNLLRILAAESGRNIVAGADVTGKVSIALRNVTWEEALDAILDVAGLAKIEKAGIIRVVSVEQLTKEREAQARVEEAKRKAEIETRTKLVEAQIKEAELAQRRLLAEVAAAEAQARGPLREETVRLSYADPEEVAKTLQGILGIPPEGTAPVTAPPIVPQALPSGPSPLIAEPPFSQLYGPGAQARPAPLVSVSQDVLAKGITIRAHKPTNTIFIRHYATDLERIKRLIREQLDVPLPQVKIEARMEILERNALEAIGVQWGGAVAGTRSSTTLIGQGFSPRIGTGTGATLTPGNPNLSLSQLLPVASTGTALPAGGNLVNLPFSALPFSGGTAPAGNIAFGIVGTNFNINLALQALATKGKTRTLARPEIVTVENNKAQISLGEEIPYATVSSAGTQIQFKEALLKLEVTPTVIRERIGDQDINKIKMLVVVENNARGDTVDLGSGGNPPAINRRKAETQVLIHEGERLVIGGVTQGLQGSNIRKVPLFGDIPVLGWLFKQRESFDDSTELVIFLTPSVLKREGEVTAGSPVRR